MNLVHHVFSSLRVEKPSDSLARRNIRRVVGARARLGVPAMRAKEKSLPGGPPDRLSSLA
jgi:hypothetical protein